MKPFRFTIARWMVATAVLAANAGLVRAVVVEEMFHGAILILIALQVGLWCLLRHRGRVRRFWLGFEISGVASVLALFGGEVVPGSALSRLLMWYTNNAYNFVFAHLPTPVDDAVMEHQDWFLVVVYFLPEFVVAVLGGLLTVCLPRMSQRPTREVLPGEQPPSIVLTNQ
jgi:hypothetical protein